MTTRDALSGSLLSGPQALHPGVDPNCPLCSGLGWRIEPQGEVAKARVCSCVSVCKLCGGSGWMSAPGASGRLAPQMRCRCRALDDAIERFDRAALPARHAASTLKSFRHSGRLTQVFMRVYESVRGWQPAGSTAAPNRGLVLWGDVGRGKTHLLCAMLRELVFSRGLTVRFVEFSHLLADLKSGFDRGTPAADLLDPLVEVDVLGIDELGKGRRTEFEETVIDEIVSRRYNAWRPVLATTNYRPKGASGVPTANLADADRTAPTLGDRVGERVFSRLIEMCDFVELEGEDFRSRLAAGDVRPPPRRR